MEEDLVTAVTSLHAQAIGPQITVSGSLNDPIVKRMSDLIDHLRVQKGNAAVQNPRTEAADQDHVLRFFVDTHPAVFAEQKRLRDQDFRSILQSILSQKEDLVDIPQDMVADLKDLAEHFRRKMGLWAKIRDTFWASLNVLPGIKVKLTGLFGAKDLYALVAIPVTTQLKKADQQQLETMLGPIAEAWFNHKLKKVQQLFEQSITAGTIRTVNDTIERATAKIDEIKNSMDICAKEMK
jgi:hypothetical protein